MSRERIVRMLNMMQSDRNYRPFHSARMLRTALQALMEIEAQYPDEPPAEQAGEALDRITRIDRFR